MKNIFRIGWLITACLLAAASCSKGDTDDGGSNNGGENPPATPTITLNKSSITFDEITDEEEVSFTSSADWIAEIINDRADSWLSVSPTSGVAGDAKIKIKANNNDSTDERSASVRIKAGSAQKTINVTQKQKDALTVTSSKFEVSAEGGEVKIEVKANINFEYEIDASAKDWVKYEGTRAMKTSTLTFSVAENDDTEKREAKITIKSGEFNEVVTIYQAGAEPSIVISKNEYVVSSDGETIAIEVASNVDVKVELPTDVDWISENTTRATSTNTYRFDISPNEEYDSRSAEIKFTNKKNNLSEVVTITQVQKDALVVAKESYTVDSEGDQIQIEVGHNVDFDVEISADWITKADNTRAFVTETLAFNIASNPTNDNREGTITFKSKDGNISQIVKVYQAQEDALIISKKDIVISEESGTVSFEIQTNVEFTVSEPNVSWLRAVVTRGLTTHTLHYEYDANTSYDSREAQIVVTDTKNNKSETIIITQAQKDAIVLAKSEYEYGAEGGNLDFEIQTNVDVTVTISDNAKEWIQQVETRALETKTLYFNVSACSAEEDREGTITISGGSATQTITVKQSGLKEILEKEREALIAFYNAMNGDNWTNNENWCSNKPVSEWYGITVENSVVTNIDLKNNNLSGVILNELNKIISLKELNIDSNHLTSITLQNCPSLEAIICNNNRLTTLNVAGNESLGTLHCNDNTLESISLMSCKNLHTLFCDNNLLKSLNLSDCIGLRTLSICNNKLTSLDISWQCPVFCVNGKNGIQV